MSRAVRLFKLVAVCSAPGEASWHLAAPSLNSDSLEIGSGFPGREKTSTRLPIKPEMLSPSAARGCKYPGCATHRCWRARGWLCSLGPYPQQSAGARRAWFPSPWPQALHAFLVLYALHSSRIVLKEAFKLLQNLFIFNQKLSYLLSVKL